MNEKLARIKELIAEYSEKIIISLVLLVFLLSIFFIYLLNNRPTENSMNEETLMEELYIEETSVGLNEGDSVEETNSAGETIETEMDTIIVDLKGAVEAPGVYEMKKGNRVIDCLDKAGGLLETADQKQVNLAQILEDQMVIYIPIEGEELTQITLAQSQEPNTETGLDQKEKINLNQATITELTVLNGIGDVKAENIIAYREENGFFKEIDEIKNVSGIGEVTYENIKEEISVGP